MYLVPFPFSDLTGIKQRPALIVSPDAFNKFEVIIACITSKSNLEYRIGDYKIQQWRKSNLLKSSKIRTRFATIDKSIIIKKIGKLAETDIREFRKILIGFFTQ